MKLLFLAALVALTSIISPDLLGQATVDAGQKNIENQTEATAKAAGETAKAAGETEAASLRKWVDKASKQLDPLAAVEMATQVDQGSVLQGWLIGLLTPENRGWSYYANAWKNPNDGNGYFELAVVKARRIGIDPASLTSGVILGATFILLTIFLGIAVISGMNEARNGGSFDMVGLGLKFILGVILLASPATVYGFARVIQEGGKTIAVYALKLANKNETMRKLLANPMNSPSVEIMRIRDQATKAAAVNYSAFAGEKPMRTMSKLLADPAAQTEDFKNAIKQRGYASNEAVMEAFKDMDKGARVNLITQLAQILISSDPKFQAEVNKLGEEYTKVYNAAQQANVNASAPGAYAFQLSESKKTLETKVLSLARKTYRDKLMSWVEAAPGDTEDLMKDLMGSKFVRAITELPSKILEFINTVVMALVGSLLLWIINVVFGVLLELSIPILCLTYPLWLVKTTSKAFLGALSSFFSFMLIPTVFVVVAMIVEGIFAFISKMVLGMSFGGMAGAFVLSAPIGGALTALGFGLMTFYFVAYIVSLVAVAWKSPAIAKGLIEGGSVISSFMGALITGLVTGALAGIGVATTVGLGMGGAQGLSGAKAAGGASATTAPGSASGTPTGAGGFSPTGAGGASPTGAGGASPTGVTPSGLASQQASAPTPPTDTPQTSIPNSSSSTASTEDKLNQKQAKMAKKARTKKRKSKGDKGEQKGVEGAFAEADVFDTGKAEGGGAQNDGAVAGGGDGAQAVAVSSGSSPSGLTSGNPIQKPTFRDKAVKVAKFMGNAGAVSLKTGATAVALGAMSAGDVQRFIQAAALGSMVKTGNVNLLNAMPFLNARKDNLVGKNS